MVRLRVRIVVAAVAVLCSLHAAFADVAPGNGEFVAEYSKALGFTKGQVLDASISDTGILIVSIDECSLCGAFKNEDSRNRIARSTLEWFLSKTGGKTGTVEWYNSTRVKIMSISGSPEHSEITSGMPCAIKKP